ncbi:MAG TPA: cellulose biosynthesis cyclic di-GMP-binding regulatory protein BcsB, partial [Anaerolineales bacterium]|nr:cellulose biosynthesis cyclic di-GMP-binding regulatory protein BcsB [Anaerolineales bacterium]
RTLTFANLGVETNIELHGPYDSNSVRFELPATWEPQSGVELNLEISSFVTSESISAATNQTLGASLDVYFNDKLQESIPLQDGKGVFYNVPISPDAVATPDSNGRHKITFFLDAALDCDLDFHKTTVSISVNSEVLFPYIEKELSLDLRRLPWPIYQETGVEKSSAVIVLPESPSADELQSGLIVAGTLGRMTQGNLPVTMVSNDQLTDDLKNRSHVVLIGKPSAFPDLAPVALPVRVVGDKYSLAGLSDDDGVLQAVPSPWNPSKALLIVGGNTDQGVVKASQALSTANLQTGDTPDYSVVANVNPITITGILTSDLTPVATSDALFSDLGYDAVVATGIGTSWLTYEFIIPSGYTAGEGPYVDFKYTTSDLVDANRSGAVVYLNDVLVGSLTLSSAETNIVSSRINLPVSVLKSGTNRLDVVINLLPRDECSVFAFSGLWVTIYPDSLLHLPLAPAEKTAFSLQDIKAYPLPFANDPSLSTTAFVLSEQDRVSWTMAARIAYDLGARVAGSILGFEAAYTNQIPEDIRAYNLIVIGEPRNLEIVADFKGFMPAHFEADSNIATLDTQQVIYRISANKKLGYLELFASPWNESGVVLGVFGTSPEGVAYAGDSLLNVQMRDSLSGNFATLDGVKAIVVDTRTGLGLGRFASNLGPSVVSAQNPATVESSSTGMDQIQNEVARGRGFILAAILGVVVIMAVVLVVALRLRLKRK